MHSTKQLIEENNEKRKLLNAKNEQLYEDFLLYIRTDLRIAEQESEEVLMDLLDHLLEGQEEGKTATDLFGTDPQAYADELIAGLPHERKRKVIPFVISQVFNLLGWFSLVNAVLLLILPRFTEVDHTISVGFLLVLVTAISIVSIFSIRFIFKLIRSTLFVQKKKHKWAYWKAGLFGGGSFALIMLLAWLLPDFGPQIHFEWWMYLGIGLILIIISKITERMTNE